jgi:hypothetical protein
MFFWSGNPLAILDKKIEVDRDYDYENDVMRCQRWSFLRVYCYFLEPREASAGDNNTHNLNGNHRRKTAQAAAINAVRPTTL